MGGKGWKGGAGGFSFIKGGKRADERGVFSYKQVYLKPSCKMWFLYVAPL